MTADAGPNAPCDPSAPSAASAPRCDPAGAAGPARGPGEPQGGLYRNIWRHAAGARVQLMCAAVLLLGSQLVKLAVPWLAAQAMNALQTHAPQATLHAAVYAGLVVATFVAAWALHGPGRVLERAVSLRVRRSHADSVYAKLMQLPLAWHHRNHSGDVQQRVGQSTNALYGFAQSQFVYLQSAVNVIGPVVALVAFSAPLGLIALVGYVLVGMTIVRFDGALMRLASRENAAERRYQAGVIDFLGNIGTVLALRLQRNTRQLLNQRLMDTFVPLRRSIALNEMKWCTVDLLGVVLTWGLVAAYVWLTGRDAQALLIGSVFMVYQYAQQASAVIGSMAGNFQGLARTRTDFASADLIWSASERPDIGAPIAPQWERIALGHLSFRHADTPQRGGAHPEPSPAGGCDAPGSGLRGVSLTLARGQRLALVGLSGAGKSTLLRVMAGLYEPDACTLEVDGAVVPGARSLASIATLMPQEADVFEATVRENMAFGDTPDERALSEAIHTSAFDEVMAETGLTLDTPITERGVNLSGGQRQRLCLARGVLAARASSLILLDEPTSALDPVTQEQVLARLLAQFSTACVVVSVHRMRLLRHFDAVVLMDSGQVLDVGTVDELLARQPRFRLLHGRADAGVDAPQAALAEATDPLRLAA